MRRSGRRGGGGGVRIKGEVRDRMVGLDVKRVYEYCCIDLCL